MKKNITNPVSDCSVVTARKRYLYQIRGAEIFPPLVKRRIIQNVRHELLVCAFGRTGVPTTAETNRCIRISILRDPSDRR